MNEIVKVEQRNVTPYRAFADKHLASAIAGHLLKFVKGTWFRGEEQTEVPPDATFVCNMEEIWSGWQRWFNNKVVEYRIARLVDFPPEVLRDDLGHLDKNLWELDPVSGNPKDPWAEHDRMVMREANDSTALLTFCTGSDGGRQAIAKLCEKFDRTYSRHDGKWPIVKLGDAPYNHRLYGLTHKPDFKIVGWAYWSEEQEAGHRQLLETPTADFFDDQIPF